MKENGLFKVKCWKSLLKKGEYLKKKTIQVTYYWIYVDIGISNSY